MADPPSATPTSPDVDSLNPSFRRSWTPPALEELPPLVDLTLDSADGDPIDGMGGSGGLEF